MSPVEPYWRSGDGDVVLYLGDCLAVLRNLPDSSIDAICTDPPYGLEFMGREWDGADGFRRSLNAADASRDNVFGRTSRTSPEYKTGKPSGARIRPPSEADQISGRAHNPTTSLVARNAPESYVAGRVFQEWCEAWARECLRVLKPGGHLLAFGGTRTWHRLTCGIEDAGFDIRDSIDWVYASGFPKNEACLKPAHEPIVMARKPSRRSEPLPGLSGCRVESGARPLRIPDRGDGNKVYGANLHGSLAAGETDEGRWPPNILLGEEAAAELDRQSGIITSGANPARRGSDKFRDAYGDFAGQAECVVHRGADSGGASRFFPVFKYEPKAPAHERPRLPDGTAWPTVKPLDLMRWLVRLVTPPGGTVLDPFCGTGTTAEACVVEGFRCITIDRDPAALQLATERLSKPIQPAMLTVDDSAQPVRAHPVVAQVPKPPPEAHPSLFGEMDEAS